MRRIDIDISKETVTIRDQYTYRVLRRQWVVFYLAMALRLRVDETSSAFLQAQELHLLGPWFSKKVESIGKEVARHLQDLSGKGMGDILFHEGRTKRWRLAILPEQISFLPSRERCELWLHQQQWDFLGGIESIPHSILSWVSFTTRALIRLEQGKIKEGLDLVRAGKTENVGSVLLGAITELVELRLCAKLGEYPDPEDWEYLSRCEGRIGKTLLIRASLAQSLAPDFDNLEVAIESLRKTTTRLQSLPDINGLGNAYNALGVLLRRNEQPDLAEKCLRYAIALLIASFDIPLLQAALFNLGHTLYQVALDDISLKEALQLIELDREICYTLGLGRDSAQGEIVAGTICLKLGDLLEAERWLQEGRKIAATLSDYNKAGVELLHARILWVKAWKEHPGVQGKKEAILAKFREALALISLAGFPSRDIEHETALVKKGEKPKWLD